MHGVFLPLPGRKTGQQQTTDKPENPEGRISIPLPAVCVRYGAFRNGHTDCPFRSPSLRSDKGKPLRRYAAIPFTRRFDMNKELQKKREELARNQKELEIYERRHG